MPEFRAYLLDRSGRILWRADLATANLECAKRHAFRILRSRRETVYGVEVWKGPERLFPAEPRPVVDEGEEFLTE